VGEKKLNADVDVWMENLDLDEEESESTGLQ
jgi:hypothetical protein